MKPRSGLGLLLGVLLLAGCAPRWSDFQEPHIRVQPLDRIERPVRIRQRLTISAGYREISFPTVFEIRPEQATFLLLSPVGTPIMTLKQEGDKLSVVKLPDRDIPLNPRRLYVEVQAMIWPKLKVDRPYSVRDSVLVGLPSERYLYRSGERFATIKAPSFSSYNGIRRLKYSQAPYMLRLETRSVRYPEEDT